MTTAFIILGILLWFVVGFTGGIWPSAYMYRRFPEQGYPLGFHLAMSVFGPVTLVGGSLFMLSQWSLGAKS